MLSMCVACFFAFSNTGKVLAGDTVTNKISKEQINEIDCANDSNCLVLCAYDMGTAKGVDIPSKFFITYNKDTNYWKYEWFDRNYKDENYYNIFVGNAVKPPDKIAKWIGQGDDSSGAATETYKELYKNGVCPPGVVSHIEFEKKYWLFGDYEAQGEIVFGAKDFNDYDNLIYNSNDRVDSIVDSINTRIDETTCESIGPFGLKFNYDDFADKDFNAEDYINSNNLLDEQIINNKINEYIQSFSNSKLEYNTSFPLNTIDDFSNYPFSGSTYTDKLYNKYIGRVKQCVEQQKASVEIKKKNDQLSEEQAANIDKSLNEFADVTNSKVSYIRDSVNVSNKVDLDKKFDCSSVFTDDIVDLIRGAYFLIEIASIILVVVLSILNYATVVLDSEQDEMKKANKKLKTRLILLVVLLLLPVLVNTTLKLFNIEGFDSENPLCIKISE